MRMLRYKDLIIFLKVYSLLVVEVGFERRKFDREFTFLFII